MRYISSGDDRRFFVMDSVTGPSERLCEVGLDLATRLNLYEDAGGTSHLEDVVEVPAFANMFDGAASVTGKPRPGWRWELRLRQGRDLETVVGHANGRWTVEGLDMLASAAPFDGPCLVLIEPHGTDLELKPPPAEKTSPSTDALSHARLGLLDLVKPLVAFGMRKTIAHRPARWYPDPAETYRFRYWNGTRWTRFVVGTEAAPPHWDETLDWGKRFFRLPKW
jgi:hypothetical protein